MKELKDINIKELLGIKKLKKFHNKFTTSLELSFSILNKDGEIITPKDDNESICSSFLTLEKGKTLCSAEIISIIDDVKKNGGVVIRKCFSGFDMFGVALTVNNDIAGYIVGCQFVSEKGLARNKETLSNILSDFNIKDKDEILKKLHRTKIITKDELVAKAELLADVFSELIYNEFELARLGNEILDKYEEMNFMQEVRETLGTELKFGKVVTLILRQAIAITDTLDGCVMLLNEDTQELEIKESYGKKYPDVRFRVGEGIAGKVVKTGKAIIVNDTLGHPEFVVKDPEQKQVSSLLCVPIKATGGKVIGVINLNNKRDNKPFTSEDERLVSALAAQAGVAIENANLYTQLEEEKEKIKMIIDTTSDGIIVFDKKSQILFMNVSAREIFGLQNSSLTEEELKDNNKLSVLRHKLKKLIGRPASFDIILMKPDKFVLAVRTSTLKDRDGYILGSVVSLRNITDVKEMERKRSEITSFLVHDLPKASKDAIKTINSIISGKKELSLNELKKTKNHLHQIDRQITKLWNFLQIMAGPLRIEKIESNLPAFIMQSIKNYDSEMKKDFIIKTNFADNIPEIRFDDYWMEELLYNLLDNAIRYSSDKFPKEITINCYPINDFIQVDFINYNEEFSEDRLPIIFDPFIQLDHFEQFMISEIGMGLPFSKHIVSAHGGKLWIKKDGDKVVVSFTLQKKK